MAGREVGVARVRGRSRIQKKGGFTYPEMAFLLLTLALFLVGTVWVVNGAIVKSHPLEKSDRAGRDADVALDRIESMVKVARQFSYTGNLTGPGLGPRADSLDFLADLDGDTVTGSFQLVSADGKVVTGLERVVIVRKGVRLMTYVYSRPDAPPEAVVLLSNLSPGDKQAFETRFRVEKPEGASLEPSAMLASNTVVARPRLVAAGVRVSIATGVGGSRLVLDRDTGLPDKPPLFLSLPSGL